MLTKINLVVHGGGVVVGVLVVEVFVTIEVARMWRHVKYGVLAEVVVAVARTYFLKQLSMTSCRTILTISKQL